MNVFERLIFATPALSFQHARRDLLQCLHSSLLQEHNDPSLIQGMSVVV